MRKLDTTLFSFFSFLSALCLLFFPQSYADQDSNKGDAQSMETAYQFSDGEYEYNQAEPALKIAAPIAKEGAEDSVQIGQSYEADMNYPGMQRIAGGKYYRFDTRRARKGSKLKEDIREEARWRKALLYNNQEKRNRMKHKHKKHRF